MVVKIQIMINVKFQDFTIFVASLQYKFVNIGFVGWLVPRIYLVMDQNDREIHVAISIFFAPWRGNFAEALIFYSADSMN